jgi:Putative Actinobacterial Holin-X, holin superfamily III
MAWDRNDPEADAAGGVASVMSDVIASLGRLVQGELALARAEAAENVKAAGAGVAKVAVAAVVGLVGLNVLAGAAVAGLAHAGLGPAWAAVIIGGVLCAVSLVLAVSGKAALSLRRLWPDRTLRGLRQDAGAVQAGLQGKGARHV